MYQDDEQDPLTLWGFLKIFTGFLVFWCVLAFLAMAFYFSETFSRSW